MSDFEKAIATAMEQSVLKSIAKGDWIAIQYSDRVKIPNDLMQQVWDMVDVDSLKLQLKQRLEQELADRIINQIAAEISTDIKQVLSVKERRETIRSMARNYIESCVKN